MRISTLLVTLGFAISANALSLDLKFTTDQQNQSPANAWTTAAMKADLANIQAECNKSSSTRLWSQDGTSSRFCSTANISFTSAKELTANGKALQTTKGLKFYTTSATGANLVRIDPNKTRGLMISANVSVLILGVKAGDVVTFGTRSGSNGTQSTWTMTNATINSGSLSTSSGTFSDVKATAKKDGDIKLTPDKLMDISYIKVTSGGSSSGGSTSGGSTSGGSSSGSQNIKLAIWNYDQLKYVKSHQSSGIYKTPCQNLINSANGLLNSANKSVMDKPKTAASGNKHDYLSQARYWWPNPNTSNGLPYIRKDGQSNPEIDKLDRNPLGDMSSQVTTLSLAYFLTGQEKYATKAVDKLKVWFLNSGTKMNPNLNYAQMIPGQNGNKGRAEGVLDAYSFIEMLDAVPLLKGSSAYTSSVESNLKSWFSSFLNWLLTNSTAREEFAAKNNHGVCYDVQVIAYASFVGNTSVRDSYIKDFYSRRINAQIQSDGKQPQELSRTLAYHYSEYNIAHILDVFQMARNAGVQVGGNDNNSFNKVIKAIDFLTPYLSKSVSAWNSAGYQQISGWDGAKKELARDLYRAYLLFPNKSSYKSLYNQYKASSEKDRFIICYIKDGSSAAKEFEATDFDLDFGEMKTTGIDEIADDNNVVVSNQNIYDLQGHVVGNASQIDINSLPKGMYIFNGKKYVVR